MRTNKPGIFAVGNINHPVETADVVAIEGQAAGRRIVEYLQGAGVPREGVAVRVAEPLRWISPSIHRVGGATAARGRLVSWVDEYIARPTLVVEQDGREVSRTRLAWPAEPGRAFRIPAEVLDGVRVGAGDVTISVK